MKNILLASALAAASAWDVARTPPMGFNVSVARARRRGRRGGRNNPAPTLHQHSNNRRRGTLVDACGITRSGVARARLDACAPLPSRPRVSQLYHCGVSEAVLNATAHSMHDSGLQAAGYIYVNSDVRAPARRPQRRADAI